MNLIRLSGLRNYGNAMAVWWGKTFLLAEDRLCAEWVLALVFETCEVMHSLDDLGLDILRQCHVLRVHQQLQ